MLTNMQLTRYGVYPKFLESLFQEKKACTVITVFIEFCVRGQILLWPHAMDLQG